MPWSSCLGGYSSVPDDYPLVLGCEEHVSSLGVFVAGCEHWNGIPRTRVRVLVEMHVFHISSILLTLVPKFINTVPNVILVIRCKGYNVHVLTWQYC